MVGAHHATQNVGGDLGDFGGALGRPGLHDGAKLVEAGHILTDMAFIDAADLDQLAQERQIEKDIGVWADKDMLAGDLGRFGAARVHDENVSTACPNFLESFPRIWDLQERPFGDRRIGADQDQTLGVFQIDKGLGERKAVDLGGHGEFIRAILSGRGIHAARADALHEALRKDRVQDGEPGRRTHIHGDRVRVVGRQSAYLLTDLGHGLFPGDAIPAGAGALHRVFEPIGRIIHLMLVEPLDAGIPLGGLMCLVGPDIDDPVVGDVHLEPAGCLANTTECEFGLRYFRHLGISLHYRDRGSCAGRYHGIEYKKGLPVVSRNFGWMGVPGAVGAADERGDRTSWPCDA